MRRITRRIGESIELVDGKGYANLTHEEQVKLLFKTLADCEDELEEIKLKLEKTQNGKIDSPGLMRAYFKVEDYLYSNGKDKPLETKAAMIWGALSVVCHQGSLDWGTDMKSIFGEFMSKQMKLN